MRQEITISQSQLSSLRALMDEMTQDETVDAISRTVGNITLTAHRSVSYRAFAPYSFTFSIDDGAPD